MNTNSVKRVYAPVPAHVEQVGKAVLDAAFKVHNLLEVDRHPFGIFDQLQCGAFERWDSANRGVKSQPQRTPRVTKV
jgi:hypothetical protein